ncbi:hypothetical protein CEUSTIGMA_g2241.t1 [Chlamydomonas eustigma]|uniref:PWI domain-containing protein n=1 Tax=Chlamydomonas eustigma TaxID=1157962 RepID=A0A250WVC3_9CHLO|nr:hypothetical protein CEUSTIGMA_g2241.t1 [Chlamydomonas eustigma]|eukprot:GAX74794.1 hypothetical protein CEUSTIGMA_g2241.t1 [Chlamydomonas eustigma]
MSRPSGYPGMSYPAMNPFFAMEPFSASHLQPRAQYALNMPPPPAALLYRTPPPSSGVGRSSNNAREDKSTTVYCGKIASTLNDEFISNLLLACGKIKSWKRATDPETQEVKSFGFCEYEDAEGALRAIQFLNGLKIDGQELMLKGNSATQNYLKAYVENKAQNRELEKAEKLLKNKTRQEEGEVIDEEATDDDGLHQGEKVLEVIQRIVKKREEEFSNSCAPLPPPPPIPARLPTAVQEGPPASSRRGKIETVPLDTAGSRGAEHRAEVELREDEDQKKESNALYEFRLREWERCEREIMKNKEREYDRERAGESERKRLIQDDLVICDAEDNMDPSLRRPIRSSRRAVERRKKRNYEEQEDDADRRNQDMVGHKVKLESLRIQEPEITLPQVTLSNSGHEQPGISAKSQLDVNDSIYQAMLKVVSSSNSRAEENLTVSSVSGMQVGSRTQASSLGKVAALFRDEDEDESKTRKIKPIVYTEEELRSVHESDPMLQTELGAACSGDPALSSQAQLRQLMDRIPTSKEGVWDFSIRWEHYDGEIMSSKFRNWINAKVDQLLGMPEPSLVTYICDLLNQHTPPSVMFEELQPVLDADSETFVIKLYRMVIYETEKVFAHL